MTHSFDEICKLDSERTQGDWEFHDGGRKNDWSESSWVQIPEHFDDNGNDSDDVIYLRLTANAQYIAAMPDAVGLLKEFKADNTKLKQLLDRAIMGLELAADGLHIAAVDMELLETKDEEWAHLVQGDNASKQTWGRHDVARETLADIRKQLDGDGNG